VDDDFALALLLLDPTSLDHAQLKRLESVGARAAEVHDKLKIAQSSREQSARTRLARRAALREEYFRTRKSSPEIRAAIAMESVDATSAQGDRAGHRKGVAIAALRLPRRRHTLGPRPAHSHHRRRPDDGPLGCADAPALRHSYFRFKYASTFVAMGPTEPTAETSCSFVHPNFAVQ
jgi:hypothetical protein